MTKHTPIAHRSWPALAGLAVLAMSLATSETHAQDGAATPMSLITTVTRTLASNGRLGGCAAYLGHDVGTETGLNCPNRWVTFGCDGALQETDKAEAMRLYDAAQLAFVTGRRVVVWVDGVTKQDTFCVASRVDVLPN